MSFSLPWSSHIHCLLDIRAEGVHVEFVKKERSGAILSLAKTTLASGTSLTGVQSAVQLVTACKEMLSKYPQFHPQSVLAFLHAPYTSRESHMVTKKFTEQVVTAAAVASMVDEKPMQKDATRTQVHEYVSKYTLNGYKVYDPRGKKAKECAVTVVRTYVPTDVYTTVLAPLESVFGVPLRVASFTEMLTAIILQAPHPIQDVCVLDIGAESLEYTRVVRGECAAVDTLPLGIALCKKEVCETAEMLSEELATSLPLLAKKTLEEGITKRLTQGIVTASRKIATELELKAAHVTVPLLLIVPESDRVFAELLAAQLPFATVLPAGDMPAMAGMVGL
jgi:hypothetical protein